MINLALALALQAPASGYADQWVDALLASKTAKAVTSKSSHCGLQAVSASPYRDHARSGSTPRDGYVTLLAVDVRSAVDAIHHTFDTLDTGKCDAAYAFITTFRETHPDIAEYVDPYVVDCELLSGRYQEAFKESVSYIKAHTGPGTWIGPDFYLQLSLAAAGCGQLYPGQDAYCIKWFNRRYADGWSGGKSINLPPANGDARKTMVLSALALAVASAARQAYFELVLKLDPSNDLAGHLLVQYDQWQGRYSDLRRVASFMIAHASDATARDFYRHQIAAVAGLPDRPKVRRSDSMAPAVP